MIAFEVELGVLKTALNLKKTPAKEEWGCLAHQLRLPPTCSDRALTAHKGYKWLEENL